MIYEYLQALMYGSIPVLLGAAAQPATETILCCKAIKPKLKFLMKNDRVIIKSANHRWMGLFFLLGGLMAYFNMGPEKSFIFKLLVCAICGAAGLWLLLKRSEDQIWIENDSLCFSQARGAKSSNKKIPISNIHAIRLKFSGSLGGNSSVKDRVYVVATDGKIISLPEGIKYSSYNTKYAGMDFLIGPLRSIKKEIKIEIQDEVRTKRKLDFSGII